VKTFTQRASGGLCFLASFTILLAGCVHSQPATKPLSGKLNVLVRPPDRTLDPIAVEQAGAAPVQSGGAMCIDANLDEPAFIYIVWFNSEGQILPLYPWNNERLEVTDVNQPPPVRRAGKLVFSPLLGGNWTFGDKPGTETVVLLARRTPLPEGIEIGKLLKSEGVPSVVGSPNEVVKVELGGAAKSEKGPVQGPLAEFLTPLAEHFELVQAVQFGHADQ
jgi:hypothetical protein